MAHTARCRRNVCECSCGVLENRALLILDVSLRWLSRAAIFAMISVCCCRNPPCTRWRLFSFWTMMGTDCCPRWDAKIWLSTTKRHNMLHTWCRGCRNSSWLNSRTVTQLSGLVGWSVHYVLKYSNTNFGGYKDFSWQQWYWNNQQSLLCVSGKVEIRLL